LSWLNPSRLFIFSIPVRAAGCSMMLVDERVRAAGCSMMLVDERSDFIELPYPAARMLVKLLLLLLTGDYYLAQVLVEC
jgi:hypothetical protein